MSLWVALEITRRNKSNKKAQIYFVMRDFDSSTTNVKKL